MITAAGGPGRICSRHDRRGRPHEDRLYRNEIRMDGLYHSLHVRPFSTLLLQGGTPLEIAIDCGTAFIGVYVVTVGMTGYFTRALQLIPRILLIIGGGAAILPLAKVSYGVYITLIGALLGCFVLLYEYIATKRLRSA